MPNTSYPIVKNFVQKSVTNMSTAQVQAYVFDSVYQLKWTGNLYDKSCNYSGGIPKRIKIYNTLGSNLWGSIYICADLEYNNLPDGVVVRSDGFIYVVRYKSLGIWGNVKNLIQGALRGLEVFTGIAVVFDIQPMLKDMSDFGKSLNLPASKIGSFVVKSIELYQKASARIDKVLHLNLIEKFHTVGRGLSPEYDNYWRAQESTLADLSSQIFGDFSTLNSYVHLAEVTYLTMINNAKVDKDKKRIDTLKHGLNVTEKIKANLTSYSRNPLNVWGDIYHYTFQEGNKYIDLHGVEIGADTLEYIGKMGVSLYAIERKLKQLRLFDTILDETNLFTLSKGVQDITTLFNETYNNVLKPTFKVIEKIYNEQQKAIAELEKRKLERLKIEQRSDILNTDPDLLSGYDKVLQDNQFIKTFNSAIEGVPEGFTFETQDIKEFIENESER